MGITPPGVHGHLVVLRVAMVSKLDQGYATLHHQRMAGRHALNKDLVLHHKCSCANLLTAQVFS